MNLRTLSFCMLLLLTACSSGGGGNGTPSPTALASLQPYGLTATAINAGVTLNWPRISGAVSYNLYWEFPNRGGKIKIADVTPPYTHGGPATSVNLNNGDVYYFSYTVVRAEGESAYSVELPVAPYAHTNYANPADPEDCSVDAQCNDLTAYPGDGQVQLLWSGIADASSYNVYWKTAHGVATTNTKITDVTSPFVLSGLTNDTPYYFVVTAMIGPFGPGADESAVSREVVAMPYAPEPLTPLTVTATPGNAQVTLAWDPVSNATSYSLLWSNSAGVTASATRIDNIATGGYVHTGLTNGQTYYYTVVALNSRGPSPLSAEVGVQPSSSGGALVPATPAGSAPETPQHVKVFSGHLQNTINADDDSNAVRYTIYWNTTGSVTNADASISDVTLPYTHTGLVENTRIYYRVVALNRYGASGLSAQVSAMPVSPQTDLLSDKLSLITDAVLRSCVTTVAASNGWSYTRQVVFLYCDQVDSPTSSPDITTLAGIDSFPNLQFVYLFNDDAPTNVSAIALLSNLSELSLWGMRLSSVNDISGLAHLTFLDLYNNQISDLSPLASLTSLRELYLDNNNIGGSSMGHADALNTLTAATTVTLGGNVAMDCAELTTLLMAPPTGLGNSVVIRSVDYSTTPATRIPFPTPLVVGVDCT